MIRKLLVAGLCAIWLFGPGGVIAQNRTVTGEIKSEEDGILLPGVNVLVKGTTRGTVSDVSGRYQIEASSNEVLVFTFIGFQTLEVRVGEQTTVNVRLRSDVRQLSEIVVTGQGTGIDKARLSTVVDVVSEDRLKNIPIVRIDQLLQSQLPNTQINLTSGSPGTASVIRSRGVSSALRSTTPVVYIDGVRVDNLNTASATAIGTGGAQSSALADIPVEDIERIEFVKGGAATTLYGSDAANGVIQVFTKRGKAGQARMTFETQLGAIRGTTDFLKYKETGELGFRPGFLQSYRLGASGGSENLTYSFSGNIYDDNSFQRGVEQRRYNLRASLNAKVSNKLNYNFTTSFASNNFSRLPNANTSFDRTSGIEQGQQGDPADWDETTRAEVDQLLRDVARLYYNREKILRFQTGHTFVYNPIEEVTINATLGLDYRSSENKEIETNAYQIAQQSIAPGTNNQGSIAVQNRNFLTTNGTLNISWDKKWRDLSFITTIGGQFFRDIDRQVRIDASNVTEGSLSVNNAAQRIGADFLSYVTNYGYYAAENVGFRNKYFLDLGVRIDYNSTFGSNINGQVFPKAGLAYELTKEKFFSDLGIEPIVGQFKIRANYGEAGNFPPPFTRDRLVLVNSYLGNPAFQPGQPGDPNLKPERTKTTEIGADLKFWNNRISVGVTYFDALTTDALFTAPFAPSRGDESQTRNLGEISNKGFEITTSFEVLKRENVELSINASANTVTNKVLSSGGAPEFNIGGFTFLGNFVKQGLPVGYFRGSRPTFAPDGTLTDVAANADLGNALPDLFGTLGLNATFFKNLTLFVSGDYQRGSQVVNTNEVLRFFNGLSDDRIPTPSLGESFFDLAGVWVESGDYLKIRNISLTYNIPMKFLGSRIKGATVGFTALNPFNFVANQIDPEVTGSGAAGALPGTNTSAQQLVTVGGFNYGTFSAPRQYLGTIRINF